MKRKLYIELLFLISIGALTTLSLPPFNYFLINFFTFPLFFTFLYKKFGHQRNLKLFFIYGWVFGFAYFSTNLYWVSISLTFDQNFKFLIPISLILIPAYLSVFYGLVSSLFIIIRPKNIISSFLVFSLIFGIFEFIRGLILTGFPWNLISYSFSNQLELLSITSIVGTYGFNLFCISLFTSPAILIFRKKKLDIGVFVIFFILLVLSYIYGSQQKEKFNKIVKEELDYKIRIVASNISLARFYSGIDSISIIKDLILISEPEPQKKTIFIWPEGILPEISQKELVEYNWLFNKDFNKNHLLIIGINSEKEINGLKSYYNTFSLYDNKINLIHSYEKINLVPFGEFLPFEKILGNIGLKSLTNNYRSFSSGHHRNIIEIDQNNFSLKILPLICYEIIYSGKLFNNPEFDLIINISEDGWFGKSIGPEQHFTHSIFRAIESGKYVIRSSNNGTSAVVNPLGQVEQRVDYGKSGYIDFEENRKIQPTIFSKYGNKIFGLLTLLYILLIISFIRIKNE